ncbi:BN860_10572g1_1 [Zygosaccharomyces bailii CLIB 213]|uniref:BN860_10572g1_1 n=1 Tax=Zygosaccharomyces bailii (strain CLIB 213 / ATCC 58445 / CBS 680 / BCRC 21525 / NBRC 1098 / NCYC 1416 / NRRL Y-2227) TaxID=1333698 RepID=A0A8J2X9A0_ZYGB2|nr:BN860_10572g1_1 [Zygosaccharomyces bailii CLIB 213]
MIYSVITGKQDQMNFPKRIPITGWTKGVKPEVPSVITFDAYNTLYATTLPVMEQYCLVGQKYGVIADPKQLTRNFPYVFKHLKTEHPNYGKYTHISANDWWQLLIREVFKPIDLPSEMVDEILTRFEGLEAYVVQPDVLEFLEKVKSKHPDIVLGIISNTDPIMYTLLRNIKLYPFFENHIYLSYDLEVKKPSREIFAHALNDIVKKHPKLIDGITIQELVSKCWHIGDEELNDMKAAEAVDWNGILIDRTNKYGYLSESFQNVERSEHHLSIDKIDGNSRKNYRLSMEQQDIVQISAKTYVASNFESLKAMLM